MVCARSPLWIHPHTISSLQYIAHRPSQLCLWPLEAKQLKLRLTGRAEHGLQHYMLDLLPKGLKRVRGNAALVCFVEEAYFPGSSETFLAPANGIRCTEAAGMGTVCPLVSLGKTVSFYTCSFTMWVLRILLTQHQALCSLLPSFIPSSMQQLQEWACWWFDIAAHSMLKWRLLRSTSWLARALRTSPAAY